MSLEDKLMSVLSTCEKDQLNIYLNDDEALDTLLKSLDIYQDLATSKDNLQMINKQMAEANLEKEPVLEGLKLQLSDAISEFNEAKSQYLTTKETYDAQKAVNGDMSLDGIMAQLQLSATKAEEKSDIQADDFFSKLSYTETYSDEDLNNYQRKFLEERTQAHIKKIKAEKMKELLPSYLS